MSWCVSRVRALASLRLVDLLGAIARRLAVFHFNHQPFLAFRTANDHFFGCPVRTLFSLRKCLGYFIWVKSRSLAAMGTNDRVHGFLLMDQLHQAKRKLLALNEEWKSGSDSADHPVGSSISIITGRQYAPDTGKRTGRCTWDGHRFR